MAQGRLIEVRDAEAIEALWRVEEGLAPERRGVLDSEGLVLRRRT